MSYTADHIEEIVRDLGEVFFVLDSGEEYIIHGVDGYEIEEHGGEPYLSAEGIRDGEWLQVEFPLSAIEHHYTHKEI